MCLANPSGEGGEGFAHDARDVSEVGDSADAVSHLPPPVGQTGRSEEPLGVRDAAASVLRAAAPKFTASDQPCTMTKAEAQKMPAPPSELPPNSAVSPERRTKPASVGCPEGGHAHARPPPSPPIEGPDARKATHAGTTEGGWHSTPVMGCTLARKRKGEPRSTVRYQQRGKQSPHL